VTVDVHQLSLLYPRHLDLLALLILEQMHIRFVELFLLHFISVRGFLASLASEFVIFFGFLEVKTLLDVLVLLIGPPETPCLSTSLLSRILSHELTVRFQVHGCVHHTEIDWATRFSL
jgi:hypothetical protein